MSDDRGEDKLTEPGTLRAWIRDVQNDSFKKKVLNRKSGEWEEKQHVWVQTQLTRTKGEESRNTRASSLKNETKDFSSAQVAESQMRVASFASWLRFSGSGSGGCK